MAIGTRDQLYNTYEQCLYIYGQHHPITLDFFKMYKDACDNSLDNLECKAPSVPCQNPYCQPHNFGGGSGGGSSCGNKKKESTMREVYVDNNINATSEPTDLSKAREALVSRLRSVWDEKQSDLRPLFFMDAPDAPKTATEAIARIVAGKYQPIDEAKEKARAEHYGYSWHKGIDWRTQPKDEAGFNAASEKLTAAYEDAKLTIRVLPEVDGLAAFKAFQAFSPVTIN